MRALITLLILAAATPVAAQITADSLRLNALEAQLQMDRQRAVALDNELSAAQARARTEQNAILLDRQTIRPRAPSVAPSASATTTRPLIEPAIDLVGIPDDRLSASQAAVRDAARNKR